MKKKEGQDISANMTVLEILSEYPETEAVFRSYDERAGECVCCQMLFETVQHIARKYNLELSKLLTKLNDAVPG